ncbi:MAG TPA: hypothetical protein VD907_04455 [Verrucomicrobiae bacterium]|nr:hypothetical protein [Verrucomicrobiae bacterium]
MPGLMKAILLARDNALPETPVFDRLYPSSTELKFNLMLANVTVVARNRRGIRVMGYGETAQFDAFPPNENQKKLELSAALPEKSGNGAGSKMISKLLGSLKSAAAVFVKVSSGDKLMINGQTIDLHRALRLVIEVPTGTPITLGGMLGAIGMSGTLGAVTMKPAFLRDTYIVSVASISGALGSESLEVRQVAHNVAFGKSSGTLTLGKVGGSVTFAGATSPKVVTGAITGDLNLTTDFSGVFTFASVAGDITARLGTSSEVTIKSGKSRSLRATLGFSGYVKHRGEVTNVPIDDIRLGAGSEVRVNNKTYRWPAFS